MEIGTAGHKSRNIWHSTKLARNSIPLVALLGAIATPAAFANVSITVANAALSADAAANGPASAFTTLGNIVITEGNNADFAVGNNVTLALKAPAGFAFNTGATPTITFTASRNI